MKEVAGAIVFWLDDLDESPLPQTGDIDLLDHLTAESIEAVETAMIRDHLFFICLANATTDEAMNN